MAAAPGVAMLNTNTSCGRALLLLMGMPVMWVTLLSPQARADEWESQVDGQTAYDEVQAILTYKKRQANEVEALFYGLRDTLYVASPTDRTTYTNNSLTPNSVDYTVKVKAKWDTGTVGRLNKAVKAAGYLQKGQTAIELRFPTGTVVIRLHDEVVPIYERLVRGGYSFEARAVLLDNEQTVLATSDNSLLLSIPTIGEHGLDFSGAPLLRTYQKAEPPDITGLLSAQEEGEKNEQLDGLASFLSQPTFLLSSSDKANFFSLPVEDLKNVTACRILRESDELLIYKRDKK
jgi:hypothetical protein